MSRETHDALEEAVRAHVLDIYGAGAIATDWYLVGAYVQADAGTGYVHDNSESSAHALLGLTEIAHSRVARFWYPS